MSQVRFDASLVERYGGRGPRYTSYPTAVQFHEGFGADDYVAEALRSNTRPSPRPLSLYLHLPFCRSLCYYCACTKVVTRNEPRARAYLEALQAEARLHAPLYLATREVEQLHLGGGTPTFYDDAELAALLTTLRECFSFAPPERLQASIEIDPRTVDPARIAALGALGFNRLSLGVQDFDPQVQRAVNRLQSRESTIALIDAARDEGFRSISVDLIYGLPLQNVAGFERTLDAVIAASPDRISLYSYAHLPHAFRAQRLIDVSELPDDATKLSLLELSIRRLGEAGYEYIGMDHFARADDELVRARDAGELQRNFQGYSTHAACDMVSLGASAIGQVGDCFYQNEKSDHRYVERVEAGEFPIVRGLSKSRDDRIRGAVIQALMCHGVVAVPELEARFDLDFASYFARELRALGDLVADGLVRVEPEAVRVTDDGRLLLRAIAMNFDGYLGGAATERFSKVI